MIVSRFISISFCPLRDRSGCVELHDRNRKMAPPYMYRSWLPPHYKRNETCVLNGTWHDGISISLSANTENPLNLLEGGNYLKTSRARWWSSFTSLIRYDDTSYSFGLRQIEGNLPVSLKSLLSKIR